jgi:glutaminyl-tRNA synthetase
MAHPNVLMRDPLLYRIRHAHHHRTGDRWCIYPMYDFAHPLEDAFEGVTHSICTLEFESNRELYDWVLDNLGPWDPRPRQYEFARLALGYTVMSKRKLLQLVNERRVSGWDDPRMPTLAGLRRRGVTPEALRDFSERIGVAKNNSVVDIGKLEYAIRSDLERRAPRALAVLSPVELVIEDWPADRVEELEIPWWPGEPGRGGRKVPFGRTLLVEREDFAEEPPPGWKRLAPGREVRLAGAYVVRCEGVERDAAGEVRRIRARHDAGSAASARRVDGTVHWVDATRSLPAQVRLYDRLFAVEQPDGDDFLSALNPTSLVVAGGARVEPALGAAEPGARYQFLRQGYFFADPVDSRPGAPAWNRTIALKDTWSARSAEGARPAARAPEPRRKKADRAPAPEPREKPLDPAAAAFLDAAVAAGADRASAARWLTNELAGLARGRAPEALLDAAAFGRFVALVDAGRVTPAAGKALLASLVEQGGDPEQRMEALGLEKVEDAGAIDAAVGRALAAHAPEAARYRAGEKKLFGVLLGAVMRETQGAADAAIVRQRLTARLEQPESA